MVNPNRTAHTGDENRYVDANEAADHATETIDIAALAKENASADAATDKLDADAHGKLAEAEAEFETEIAGLRAERDEMRDRWLRAMADAENARKRGERDRREGEQYGGSKLARDLLPVYDNLTRALDAASSDATGVDKALKKATRCYINGLTLRSVRSCCHVFIVRAESPGCRSRKRAVHCLWRGQGIARAGR